MTAEHPRIKREKSTLKAMIRMYCKAHHDQQKMLCRDCQGLQEYAYTCLDKCTFHEEKPTCAKCTVHCYKPDMREKVKIVMRYAGPRMLLRHPILAVLHLRDETRKAPHNGKPRESEL